MPKSETHNVDASIEDAELIARYVADRDVSCPVCSHNLRGVQSAKCPECGARLALHLGVRDADVRYRSAWIVALLGIAVSLGAVAILAIDATVSGRWGVSRQMPGYIELWIVTVCLSVALAVAIARRKWFDSKGRVWRWRTAVATCVLLSLLMMGLLEFRSLSGIMRTFVDIVAEAGRLLSRSAT